jgi:hypothetical protein
VTHVEPELPALTTHLGSSPVVSGVRVSRFLDFCAMFFWSFCLLLSFFGHCIICPSLIYGFCLPFVDFKLFLSTSHHCIRTLKLISCAGNRNQPGLSILSWHVDPHECHWLTLLFEIGHIQCKQSIHHLYFKTTTVHSCRIQDLIVNSTLWCTLHL